MSRMSPALTRDSYHARIGGVCAGLARHFRISRFWVRLAAVLFLLAYPPLALLGYGLLWWLLDPCPRRYEDRRFGNRFERCFDPY